MALVEREAISAHHAARFLLVGTINPEEGELRPQLLDRFGLAVLVETSKDPGARAEIVRRRLSFEADPDGFARSFAAADRQLAARIIAGRERLSRVVLPERELLRITSVCARLNIDGARGDIVWARTARALAALDGDDTVDSDHVRRAAHLALGHRRRRDPLADGSDDAGDLERALDDEPDVDGPDDVGPDDVGPDDEPPGGGRSPPVPPPAPSGVSEGRRPNAAPASSGDNGEEPFDASRSGPRAPGSARRRSTSRGGTASCWPGRRATGRRASAAGKSVGAIDARPATPLSDDLSVVATLRDQIPQRSKVDIAGVRAWRPRGVFVCLVVDASGSMGAPGDWPASKGHCSKCSVSVTSAGTGSGSSPSEMAPPACCSSRALHSSAPPRWSGSFAGGRLPGRRPHYGGAPHRA